MSAGHDEDKGGHGIRTTMTRRDNKRHERSWDTNYHDLTAKVDDDLNQSTNCDMIREKMLGVTATGSRWACPVAVPSDFPAWLGLKAGHLARLLGAQA
jgi:hypothetical protein